MSKKQKRTTTKQVQATENLPAPIPKLDIKPEIDEGAWGDDGLTLKQRLFVRFYVGEAGGIACKAAALAGYKDDNSIALGVTATRTLRKANVQRAIEREIGKRFGSADDVRNGIAAIANGNAADFMTETPEGDLEVDLKKMAEAGALGLIHQIQDEVIKTEGSAKVIKRKFRLYDKLRALETLAKMNGQLIERRDITSNGKTIEFTLNIGSDNRQSVNDRITAN